MIFLARPNEMNGPVEIDKVYIGGLEKNKHADKKDKTGKVAVVGIRDRLSKASPVPEPQMDNSPKHYQRCQVCLGMQIVGSYTQHKAVKRLIIIWRVSYAAM